MDKEMTGMGELEVIEFDLTTEKPAVRERVCPPLFAVKLSEDRLEEFETFLTELEWEGGWWELIDHSGKELFPEELRAVVAAITPLKNFMEEQIRRIEKFMNEGDQEE